MKLTPNQTTQNSTYVRAVRHPLNHAHMWDGYGRPRCACQVWPAHHDPTNMRPYLHPGPNPSHFTTLSVRSAPPAPLRRSPAFFGMAGSRSESATPDPSSGTSSSRPAGSSLVSGGNLSPTIRVGLLGIVGLGSDVAGGLGAWVRWNLMRRAVVGGTDTPNRTALVWQHNPCGGALGLP